MVYCAEFRSGLNPLPLISMDFSVVICTYNRLDHLMASVSSALHQSLPADAYEVVVVDNASTDGTAAAVQALLPDHGNLRYMHEARLGLATARNTGWQAAQGQYVAFLDDDAKAENNWLETAKRLIADNPTNLRCVGGPIHPFYTSPTPDWWLDKYEIRTRGAVQRHLKKGEFFSGSNMIWLKSVLETYGGFESTAGMKGNQLGMGEETGLFRRIWEAEESPVFLYSPDLRVYHWVPPEKMTMAYILKRATANGQFEARFALSQNPGFGGRLKSIGSTLKTLAVQIPAVLIKRLQYKTTENWYFDHCFIPIQNVSKLLGLLGFKISVNQRKQ
ncbi:MAG: glycosyltransferase [Anaerolineaceae bacterium]|nr:glycosyltransferase [Anaerolineaceae bacterium]